MPKTEVPVAVLGVRVVEVLWAVSVTVEGGEIPEGERIWFVVSYLDTAARRKLTRMIPKKVSFPVESRSSVALIGFIIIGFMTSDRTTSLGTVSIIRCIISTQVSRNPIPCAASVDIVALSSLK